MEKQAVPVPTEEVVEATVVTDDEFDDLEVETILPAVAGSKELVEEKEECIVKDEELTGLYDEVLDNCRKDRQQADEILTNFLDMVMNDGDASSASKEAIVNILKIKSDTADKMSKIADLKTRIKLKDRDTFPRYLSATKESHIHFEGGTKRDLLKAVAKLKKTDGAQPRKKNKSG